MPDEPEHGAPGQEDSEREHPHRRLHKAITGLEYDAHLSRALKPDPPIPLWTRACVAKVVRDVIEDSRHERERLGPRIAVESVLVSTVARGVLRWLLRSDRFELSAGPASLRRLEDGRRKTLICRNGQLFCWLETRQLPAPTVLRHSSRTRISARLEAKENVMRSECIDLSTDSLGSALVAQSWERDRFSPQKVRWDRQETLRPALARDRELTQAALQLESERPLNEQAGALLEVAIRKLESAGVVPEILQNHDSAVTPPVSVSVATVYSACLEYPELWTATSETLVGPPDGVPGTNKRDFRAELLAALEKRL